MRATPLLALLIALLGADTAVCAPSPPSPVQAPAQIQIRDVTIADGRIYRLRISVPSVPPPAGGFPVLYVLDGNAWFEMADVLARAKVEEYGPLVVVGIGYPSADPFDDRRLNDLTPTPPAEPQLYGQGARVGGADAFVEVVTARAPAQVAQVVKIDPSRRAIFGHSLGGLFVLHLMFTHPDAFDSYVAASPSIWWNRPFMAAERSAAHFGCPPPRALLTAGGRESELGPMDETWLRSLFASQPKLFPGKTVEQGLQDLQRKLIDNRMAGNAKDMAGALRAQGLEAGYVLFEGEDHMSVVPPALNRALRFIAGTRAKRQTACR